MVEHVFSFLKGPVETKPRFHDVYVPPYVSPPIVKPPREFNYLRIKQKGQRNANQSS